MLELRILSGYHRGATLPLGEEALSIGSDDDAGVVLADPGLAPHHARLAPADGGWTLTPVDGVVRGDQDNAPLEQVWLGAGGCARVGAVWLTVCGAGAAWQDPPPEPADAPMAIQEAIDAPPAPPGDGVTAAAATIEAAMREEEAAAAPAAGAGGAGRARGARMIFVPVAAVALLSAAAAYAWTAHPGMDPAIVALHPAPGAVLPAAPGRTRVRPGELAAALRKRLGEIDLLARVTLDLQERAWTIRGALDDDESARLQRMLRSFTQRYAIDFPVNVRIGSPESMLPFRINQVMSGTDPSIVLDDGRRLYVGDEYRGVRLAAVAGHQLRFTGAHNLDVAW